MILVPVGLQTGTFYGGTMKLNIGKILTKPAENNPIVLQADA